jgi:peroxiredoxin family protein
MSTSAQQGKYTRLLVIHAARQFLGREVNIFATFFTTIIHKCRLILVRFQSDYFVRRFVCTATTHGGVDSSLSGRGNR